MKHTDPPSREVSIHVEHEGQNKFKIRTDQLEQIGALLRGRQFSIFHSVILPLLVGGSIFTYFFQYVSWSNQVGVQHATEVATQAAHTYEKAAAALSTRLNAMFEFVPSLIDVKAKEANIERGKQPQSSTVDLRASAGSAGETQETFLRKFDLDIKQQRFASYYEQHKLWNESYFGLLSEIEITLDRPVFSQAEKVKEFLLHPHFCRR